MNSKRKVGVPGGGWADEDDYQEELKLEKNNQSTQIQSQQLKTHFQPYQKGTYGKKQNNFKKPKNQKRQNNVELMKLIDLKDLVQTKYEYEMKIINDIIKPNASNLRIKPEKQLLKSFIKSSKTLGVNLIGSGLLYKLKQKYQWVVKAKTLYVIQELVKTIPDYKNFFKKNITMIESMEIPVPPKKEYGDQVRKLQCETLAMIKEIQGEITQDTSRLKLNITDDIWEEKKQDENSNHNQIGDLLGDSQNQQKPFDGLDFFSSPAQEQTGDFDLITGTPVQIDIQPKETVVQSGNAFGFIQAKPAQKNKQDDSAFGFLQKKQKVSENKVEDNLLGLDAPDDNLLLHQPTNQNQQHQHKQKQQKVSGFGFLNKPQRPQHTKPQQDLLNLYSQQQTVPTQQIQYQTQAPQPNLYQQNRQMQHQQMGFQQQQNIGFQQQGYGQNFQQVQQPHTMYQQRGLYGNQQQQNQNKGFQLKQTNYDANPSGIGLTDLQPQKKKTDQEKKVDEMFNFCDF